MLNSIQFTGNHPSFEFHTVDLHQGHPRSISEIATPRALGLVLGLNQNEKGWVFEKV